VLVPLAVTSPPRRQAPRRVVILGSTGSIGQSALEVIRRNPEAFEVLGLLAGRNVDLLARQAAEFRPRFVALADEPASRPPLPGETEFLVGGGAATALASLPEADTVVAAVVGAAGLPGVMAGLAAGKTIALANKESLVMAGSLVAELMRGSGAVLLPVDSEHSAIFQCLQGAHEREISRLILTASGGPFLDLPAADLDRVTPEQATNHPRWRMGPKISVDSATMFNKALELIEAHWLFGLPEEKIDVIIHPGSIVHSAVELIDGSLLAQLSTPDMKGPIAFALSYPIGRLPGTMTPLRLEELGKLEFRPLEAGRFPAVGLARQCLRAGGAATAVMNIANEVAVGAFLEKRLSFSRIVPVVERALEQFSGRQARGLAEVLELEREVREVTSAQLG